MHGVHRREPSRGRHWIVSAHRVPDCRVQDRRIGHVRVLEVLSRRGILQPTSFGGRLAGHEQVVERDVRQHRRVRGQVGRVGEDVHRDRGRIERVHGRDPDQQLEGPDERDSVVHRVDERTTPVVRADYERRRSMRVHVVGTVLRVVFEHHDRRVAPVRAARDGLHEAAERVVVVGDEELRRRVARGHACRVIVGQAQDRQRGKMIAGAGPEVCDVLLEVVEPGAEAGRALESRVSLSRADHRVDRRIRSGRRVAVGRDRIGRRQIEVAERRAEMPFERRFRRERIDVG